MRFSKWHALGNSYLVVEPEDLQVLDADVTRRLCDTGYGIGADGVLEMYPKERGTADVVVWNPDGSRAEFSGNGARIAARWLAELTGLAEVQLAFVDRRVAAVVQERAVALEVGIVSVEPPEMLDVGEAPLEVTPVSVGNPHAVVRLDFDENDVDRLGPVIERHPRFPDRTNVQFLRVLSREELVIAVWERGAGRTRSSGSSSVAGAAAAAANGWCGLSVTVVHAGAGDLLVELELERGGERRYRARLTGPVTEIARGEVL